MERLPPTVATWTAKAVKDTAIAGLMPGRPRRRARKGVGRSISLTAQQHALPVLRLLDSGAPDTAATWIATAMASAASRGRDKFELTSGSVRAKAQS